MGDQIVTVPLERGERRPFVEKGGILNSLPSRSPPEISTTRDRRSESFSFGYQVSCKEYCPHVLFMAGVLVIAIVEVLYWHC